MEQKIKLELTEQEAKALISVLDGGMREIASDMRRTSPIKESLWFAHLRDLYQTSERIMGNLREPQMV